MKQSSIVVFFMWEHFYVDCMCPVSLVQEILCECQPHPSSGVLVTITLIGCVACVEGAKTCTKCEIGFPLYLVASPSYQKRGLLPSCQSGSLEDWAGFVSVKCVFPSPHTGALLLPQCWSMWGLCAYRGPVCFLCMCLHLHSHTQPKVMSSPLLWLSQI